MWVIIATLALYAAGLVMAYRSGFKSGVKALATVVRRRMGKTK